MRLFASIDPRGGNETVAAAARTAAAHLVELPAPRSLCELRPDEEDSAWLATWAASLSAPVAQRWLTSFADEAPLGGAVPMRRLEAFGLLLLLAGAEAARREAREGHVWSVVQACFAPEARTLLFTQGQPTPWHKAALEGTAIRLRLRHVFGVEGTQNYYVSVYLQFGFTRRGVAQVPYWLAGQPPSEAVQALLGDRLGSAGFQELWRALRGYRQNNLTEARLRQVLAASPWILPDWADELVGRARERLELGTASADAPGRAAELLEPPHLEWFPPAEPRFATRFVNLANFDLSDSRYELSAGGAAIAALLRQPDETYAFPERVALAEEPAQQALRLLGEAGQSAAVQLLTLWDPAEEINVFELPSGRRAADAWQERLSTQRAYALLTAPDLDIHPRPATWRLVAGGARRLWHLPAGWSPELAVLLDGQQLWTPHLAPGPRPRPEEPSWAAGMRVACRGKRRIPIGEPIELELSGLGEGIEVEYLRLDAEPHGFTRDGALVVTEPLELTAEHAVAGVTLSAGVRRDGERARVHRALDREVIGAARFTEGGWEVLRSRERLTVSEAREFTYRLFMPGADPSHANVDPALFEGATFSSRLPRVPRPLGTLGGYGGALRVRNRPYNADGTLLWLASAVVSPGVLTAVERPRPGIVRLRLGREIAPGPGHQVLHWPGGGPPTLVPAERIRAHGPSTWDVPTGPQGDAPPVLAVAYEGARLGAWWPEELATCWELPPASVCSALRSAALIRWLHLPVLEESARPLFAAFARSNPGAALAAWVLDRGLPAPLHLEPDGEEWLAAVRHLFGSWQPTVADLRALVPPLRRGAEDDPLAAVARALEFDPLLLRAVLRAWPVDADRGSRLDALRRDVAGLGTRCSEAELRTGEAEVLDQAAELMQVDAGFVRSLADRALRGGPLSDYDERNLPAALGAAPFRHYLMLRVLEAASLDAARARRKRGPA